MQDFLIVALVVAIGTGLTIGVQTTLINWGGRLVGPLSTGLLVNISGGTLGVLLLLAFSSRLTSLSWGTFKGAAPYVVAAGMLGVGIVAGAAFALPRIGIAAGMLAVILGQMLVATIVDTNGWGGLEPIPLSLSRVAGLVLLVVATWLLLPRTA